MFKKLFKKLFDRPMTRKEIDSIIFKAIIMAKENKTNAEFTRKRPFTS